MKKKSVVPLHDQCPQVHRHVALLFRGGAVRRHPTRHEEANVSGHAGLGFFIAEHGRDVDGHDEGQHILGECGLHFNVQKPVDTGTGHQAGLAADHGAGRVGQLQILNHLFSCNRKIRPYVVETHQ